MSEEVVLLERRGRVAILKINRPEALNALNSAVMTAAATHVRALDPDPEVGCIILTGSERAFAAGADIKEMQPKSFPEMYADNMFSGWDAVAKARTPIIAAVAGYALGGGCELAMMCDLIIAADTAKFGQPEITLGVMPGMGGGQRLARAVGKYKAMDLLLTGRMIDAAEADRIGLASRVVPADKLMDEALAAAEKIAGYGKLAAMANKEAGEAAFETGLEEGLRFELRLFQSLFATEDQSEGMAAFAEKRPPNFKGE